MKKTVFYLVVILLLQACNSGNKQYNIAYPFKEDENDRWGLIDLNGNILIANEWENEPSIAIDGIVQIRNKKGLCEYWTAEKNTKQIGDEYINALPFREDLAGVVSKDSICEFIDKEGKVILSLNKLDGKKVISITSFFEGKAGFKNEDGKLGYINKKGEVIIKPVYDYSLNFNNGTALVGIKNNNTNTVTYYLLNENNKPIEKFPEGYNFRMSVGGYYVYTDDNGNNWGIMNNRGDKILRPSEKYKDLATSLNKEYFSFTDGEKTGIINLKGEVIIRAKYNMIVFTDNYFLVDDNGKAGFINKTGDEVIKPIYDNARPMINNKAYVQDRSRWILIDNKGTDLLKKDFYVISDGSENLFNLGNYLFDILKRIDAPQRPFVVSNNELSYSFNGTIKLTSGDVNIKFYITANDLGKNITGYYFNDNGGQIKLSGIIEDGRVFADEESTDTSEERGSGQYYATMKFTSYVNGQASDKYEITFMDFNYTSGSGTWYSADGQHQADFYMDRISAN